MTMAIQLLPDDFDHLLQAAVQIFWSSRQTGSVAQGGSRGHVISGKNMDGFIAVVESIARHCGLPSQCVISAGHARQTNLPGYFRPTKGWDVLVILNGRLVAALEFKSQIGSIGNNYPSRCEEVIGLGVDLQDAIDEGLCNPRAYLGAKTEIQGNCPDPRPPFTGYLLLLEGSPHTLKPVTVTSPHYPIDPAFKAASYADRYRILCERLMSKRLFSAAAMMLTPLDEDGRAGAWREMSTPTGPRALFTALAGALHASGAEVQPPSTP